MISLPRFGGRSFALVVGDDGTLFVPNGMRRTTGPIFVTGPGAPGVETIRQALADRPHVPVTLLVDTLTQIYRRESVPKVGFLDRAKVLQRRLDIAFPGVRFHGALPASDVEDRPGQRTYLFVSLPDAHVVDPWLKLLDGVPNPVRTLSLLPIECAGVATALDPPRGKAAGATWSILVTWHLTGGFRHIVARNGEFMFARMTPNIEPETEGEELASECIREIESTQAYIRRLSFKDSDATRVTLVLPERAHAPAVRAQARIVDTSDGLRVLSPAELAAAIGAGTTLDAGEQYCDAILAAWVARRRSPRLSMLPERFRQRAMMEHGAKWGAIAAGLLLLAVCGEAVRLHLGAEADRAASRELAAERAAVEAQAVAMEAELGRLPIPYATLAATVALRAAFAGSPPPPWSVLDAVGSALDPTMRLSGLIWQVPADREISAGLPPADTTAPPPSGTPAPADPSMTDLLMTVQLYRPDIDRREAVDAVEALAETLGRALPRHEVSVARPPVALRSDQTLTNAATDARAKLFADASFSADIRIRGPRP